MNQHSKTPRWLWVVRSLLLGALLVSAYLLYGSLTGERLPGCGVASGCDAVLSSRWAYILGTPVSLPAVLMDALALLASFWLLRPAKAGVLASRVLLIAAAALISAALYFIALQLFVIGSICRFCMTAHACGLTAGGLILWHNVPRTDLAASGQPPPRRGLAATAWALAGIFLVGLLAAGQVLFKPKTFSVEAAAGLSARETPRILQLHGGTYQLDLRAIPLRGSPEAPCVIVHLFDYTCPHCRRLHPILNQAFVALSNQVAIASLVVPLATNCNRLLKRPIKEHLTACELAHAALAVWRTNPQKLDAFEEWLFTGVTPPTPQAVEAKAREMVGTNAFNTALADPWIAQHLARNIDLYESNYVRLRKQTLPELMIGTNIISGSVRSVEDLYKVIATQFNVRVPASTNRPPS